MDALAPLMLAGVFAVLDAIFLMWGKAVVGRWPRVISRRDSPNDYWTAIGVYASSASPAWLGRDTPRSATTPNSRFLSVTSPNC